MRFLNRHKKPVKIANIYRSLNKEGNGQFYIIISIMSSNTYLLN